jgi:hypothetical protein
LKKPGLNSLGRRRAGQELGGDLNKI